MAIQSANCDAFGMVVLRKTKNIYWGNRIADCSRAICSLLVNLVIDYPSYFSHKLGPLRKIEALELSGKSNEKNGDN